MGEQDESDSFAAFSRSIEKRNRSAGRFIYRRERGVRRGFYRFLGVLSDLCGEMKEDLAVTKKQG